VSKEHWLMLESLSPLCIGSYKATQFIHTEEEIPGSVIRGAFARHIGMKKGKSSILKAVSDMRFGFFRPTLKNASYPFPLTSQQCKSSPGFRGKGHGIFDSLLLNLVYEEIGGETPWEVFEVPLRITCRECGSEIETVKGYYTRNDRYTEVKVTHTSQTKVPIDRRRRSSREGKLYNIAGIEPHTKFVGRIWCPDEQVAEVMEALERFGVGALTGRGFGSLNVKRNGNVNIGTVEKRLEEFNKKLLNVWKDISSLVRSENAPSEPEATYFTVDLLSPAILTYPIPTTRLSLTIEGTRYEPVYWVTGPAFIGGWSPALGLPKSTHLGADIGSTYVFKTDLDLSTLLENLDELEKRGIGFRSNEGYGEILVCHPFHLEVTQV
jgi:CRISPR-associated protein Csx10